MIDDCSQEPLVKMLREDVNKLREDVNGIKYTHPDMVKNMHTIMTGLNSIEPLKDAMNEFKNHEREEHQRIHDGVKDYIGTTEFDDKIDGRIVKQVGIYLDGKENRSAFEEKITELNNQQLKTESFSSAVDKRIDSKIVLVQARITKWVFGLALAIVGAVATVYFKGLVQ